MIRHYPFSVLIVSALLFVSACSQVESDRLVVSTQQEFKQAVEQVQPGDTIALANGVWRDFEILLVGQGTAEQPITLTAETKGEVIISGQSNLRLAGEHLVVSGLVFKDGFTPTGSVIAFRRSSKELANNSRVTEVVIDGFNNPERRETDYWVSMFGKNNRFDHNHLANKQNKGVTMAVRLNSEASRDNNHRIDHNYFGPRQILGSNGGETLRVGTSHYSLTESNTVVTNNYFDRCDGELEIISNKAAGNVFKGNVFYQSRGTLTMRHGSGTLIEDNVFFGNNADHTGGIRVINGDQTIRNNYIEGLAGYRFGGALVVMNGVPNSPINRYHQVDNAVIENNSIVMSDHIQLAAGSDQERSAVPVNSKFAGNLVVGSDGQKVFTVYDDVSGIKFENNAQHQADEFAKSQGFKSGNIELARAENGLLYPVDAAFASYGASKDLKPIRKQDTGVVWYAKPDNASIFGGTTSASIGASPPGSLAEAIKNANSGDVLALEPGEHVVSRILEINKPLTLRSADAASPAKIVFERTALFEIQNGGSLQLQGLHISGAQAPDSAGNAVIRTQRASMLQNYQLIIEDSVITDLDINHSFNFLKVAKSTFADQITIKNSQFSNISGAILKLDAENDDYGIYNAEYVTIQGSSFTNVKGALVDYYRGGTDESTFGPHFELSDSTVTTLGNGKRNKSGASMLLHGVQVTNIHSNTISNSPAISLMHTVGEPVSKVQNNKFVDSSKPAVVELNSNKTDTAFISGNMYQ